MAFPDMAVTAMKELTTINYVGYGTATLLLTLARPDRLLSLNSASTKGFGALSGKSPSTLGKPENYRQLLQWLYEQLCMAVRRRRTKIWRQSGSSAPLSLTRSFTNGPSNLVGV